LPNVTKLAALVKTLPYGVVAHLKLFNKLKFTNRENAENS
jgi:hypothetical protein